MQQNNFYNGIINRFKEHLPIDKNSEVITLAEGNTPLIKLENILPKSKNIALYAKFEGLNPTGSFKDRGMTMAVTKAVAEGSKAVICASTGNTSAAAAAYAARAGIKCFVLIPEGKIAKGKLAQAIIHGALVLQVATNFDNCLKLVKLIANNLPVTIVNSINPFRLEGQKTAAFEIIEALGDAPNYHCLPVGNAGNISAYWMGYCEYYQKSKSKIKPRMLGYQAELAAPFVAGHVIHDPETIATAIRIGAPEAWDKAWAASRDSEGWFDKFSDEIILQTQRLLAEKEGIFCEPASAIAVAGALRDIAIGRIASESKVVCTLTGHGLKDPDIAIEQQQGNVINLVADEARVLQAVEQNL